MRDKHQLRIKENQCEEILNGNKTFAVAYDDHYKVGDIIEFVPVDSAYLPIVHEIANKKFEITYIATAFECFSLRWGYCIFSFRPMKGELIEYTEGENTKEETTDAT